MQLKSAKFYLKKFFLKLFFLVLDKNISLNLQMSAGTDAKRRKNLSLSQGMERSLFVCHVKF